MSITYLIIGFTCLISVMAFSNHEIKAKLMHWPYEESRSGEWHRWLTSGFLHADWMHLIFNMLTLFFFGKYVEAFFQFIFPAYGGIVYLLFYLLAIVAASSATFQKYKNSPSFASIGASGAVAAVLFASILLNPTSEIGIFLIPVRIPGFIFGILYLWFSSYEAQRARDNIDHTAHFFGALFGFFFPLILKPSLFSDFIEQLRNWL